MICPTCHVPLATYATRVVANTRKRYKRCPRCKACPDRNIVTLPLEHAPRRAPRPAYQSWNGLPERAPDPGNSNIRPLPAMLPHQPIAPASKGGYALSMDAASKGILIAVEGIDGAGKTTQVRLLYEALLAAGEPTVCSKEPTDGEWGQRIRHSAQHGRMSLEDELRAFVEDRKQHVRETIRPALARGEIVLLDRYYFSTIAYQGARGADIEAIAADMRELAPTPDAVILIDVDPTIALHRIGHRGDIPNGFERLESLQVIRRIFLGLADHDPSIFVVDGLNNVGAVYSAITEMLLATVLKAKRCAKSYDCDTFYCSAKINGECRWVDLYRGLQSRQPASAQ